MASVLKFVPTRLEIEEEIRRRNVLAEEHRREKFIAARKIQAWIRGIVSRRHLRKLHESANTIQRIWRGHRARIFADEYTVKLVHEMWENYYNIMATRIQAAWRGYWTRKNVLNFLERRRWLASVYDTNKQTREDMKLFRSNVVGYVRGVLEQESMLWILYILFKLHHLLRTKQRPGVITRLDKRCFTFIEEMLKCLEYDLYRSRIQQPCSVCHIDEEPSFILRGTYFERCREEIQRYEMSLKKDDTSLSRSQSYEDNKILASVEDLGTELMEENKLLGRKLSGDTFSYGSVEQHEFKERQYWSPMWMWHDVCSSSMTPRSVRSIELYNTIEKMDCRLDRLRVKCPIHNANNVNSH